MQNKIENTGKKMLQWCESKNIIALVKTQQASSQVLHGTSEKLQTYTQDPSLNLYCVESANDDLCLLIKASILFPVLTACYIW